MTVTTMTRRQKRALRLGRLVTAREARWAARMARLDYKVSSESGAMKVPSRVRTWHLNGRANGHEPPPGVAWDRTGPAYVIAAGGSELPRPVINHRWQARKADPAARGATE